MKSHGLERSRISWNLWILVLSRPEWKQVIERLGVKLLWTQLRSRNGIEANRMSCGIVVLQVRNLFLVSTVKNSFCQRYHENSLQLPIFNREKQLTVECHFRPVAHVDRDHHFPVSAVRHCSGFEDLVRSNYYLRRLTFRLCFCWRSNRC